MPIQHDPNTGLWIDDSTGNVYHDNAGQQVVTDPSLKGQAVRNLQAANQLQSHLAKLNDQFNANVNRQQQFDTSLNRTISGEGPSVARAQLYQTLDNIGRQQQAQASGATGANAPLAQYGAAQNTGRATAEANAAGAGVRAEEVARAQAIKGQNLGQIGGEVGQQYATNVTGSNQAAANATGAAEKQAEIDAANKKMWLDFTGNLINSGGLAAIKAAA